MQKLLLLLLLPIAAFSQSDPITLEEAFARRLVTMHADGAGGHTGQSITLHLERLGSKALRLRIPAGTLFLPADSTLQTLITVKEELFTLNEKKAFVNLYGLCTEAHDGSPTANIGFAMGQQAKGALLKLAEYISKNQLYKEYDAQTAVWCVTDSLPVASISHKGLLAATCQIMGMPLPEYKIVTQKPVAAPRNPAPRTQHPEPRRPALEYEPMSVEGAFQYQSNTEKILNVYVTDEAGNKVRTIFENQRHPGGWARYSFYFKTTKLPRGNYEVCLHDGEKVVKKIKVRY